jgi:hypothetical protein
LFLFFLILIFLLFSSFLLLLLLLSPSHLTLSSHLIPSLAPPFPRPPFSPSATADKAEGRRRASGRQPPLTPPTSSCPAILQASTGRCGTPPPQPWRCRPPWPLSSADRRPHRCPGGATTADPHRASPPGSTSGPLPPRWWSSCAWPPPRLSLAGLHHDRRPPPAEGAPPSPLPPPPSQLAAGRSSACPRRATIVPLPARAQPRCPDGPHRGQVWQKVGRSHGSLFLQLPPTKVLQSPGFPAAPRQEPFRAGVWRGSRLRARSGAGRSPAKCTLNLGQKREQALLSPLLSGKGRDNLKARQLLLVRFQNFRVRRSRSGFGLQKVLCDRGFGAIASLQGFTYTPSVPKKLTFRTATRSSKYNFDLLLI